MADTSTPRVQLGATTLNRKWYCDLAEIPASGPIDPADYVGLFGVTDLKVNPGTVELVDASDFDGGGYTAQEATSASWGAEGKLRRAVLQGDPTAYDPGQELLRVASRRMGNGNRLAARFYEMEPDGPRVEAFAGIVNVTYSDDGGDMKAKSTASFTLVGAGAPVQITHPDAE
jgi:hypothetical protein